MGACGELAANTSRGPGSFVPAFLDALWTLDRDTLNTHSREGDELADWLRGNVERAFRATGLPPPAEVGAMAKTSTAPRQPEPTASAKVFGTPYRFTYAAHFPKPALPRDNPLTEEGVALGRRVGLHFSPDL